MMTLLIVATRPMLNRSSAASAIETRSGLLAIYHVLGKTFVGVYSLAPCTNLLDACAQLAIARQVRTIKAFMLVLVYGVG